MGLMLQNSSAPMEDRIDVISRRLLRRCADAAA